VPVPPPGLEAAALAAAADGVVATDPAGTIALVNRAALALTGFAERELVGNTLHGLLHPACEDPLCPVLATQRDGTPRTFVTETMRRRDGGQAAAEVALSAMREGGLVAILHDLTDRRAEEDSLRATAAGYRDLVEGVGDWIWTADRSGVVTFSNRGGEAVLGYRPARLIGHPLLDVVAPEARDDEARRLQEAAAAGQGWSTQVRRLHADGTERTLDSRASPIVGAEGELLGWRGVEREAAPPEPAIVEPVTVEPVTEEPVTEEPEAAAPEAPPPGVTDVEAWQKAQAFVARQGVVAEPAAEAPPSEEPAPEPEPEPELGPPLTAPVVRPAMPTGDQVAIVRQPIADAEGAVVGFELLVGGGALGPRPLGEAGTTAAMLLDVFGDVGIDRLSGRQPAWVTITPAFLLEVGTPPVRPDRVVLQIPAAPVPAEALTALQRLHWSGYTVALTGYDGRAELVELLDIANMVKVTVAGRSDDELRAATQEPAKREMKLVANRVETPEEVERCAALGFSLFQGAFFAKPNLVRQRRVGTGGIASLRTLAAVAAPDASFEDLEQAISKDVGLSLKLLRYVNSAFFSLPRTVGSVHEALTLLGMATVRRWATVMALVEATADAPEELVELALQRARMCEVLGGNPDPEHADALFTVGLFSVADALLDAPMEEVLETLPFSDEIRAALLRHEGTPGELLERVMEYERGEFPSEVRRGGLTLTDAYSDAVPWAGEARRATTP
jgi:EAL and modified HD-GYP domain-containing signal transduction protein